MTCMQGSVAVVDANRQDCLELCAALERERYPVGAYYSLLNLGGEMGRGGYRVVILDLDTLPVDNRLCRELRRANPELRIISLSNRPFHPELEESMGSHIYASLSKPVDIQELLYWLRSIYENERAP